MNRPWRALAWAAAFHMVAAVAVADAQTVVVTKAQPQSAAELVLDANKIASGTADASGIATLDVNLPAHGGQNEIDVRVSVERCGDMTRVLLIEPGAAGPAPDPVCSRSDITGIFVMRRDSTILVELSQPTPTAWLTQGTPPKNWLHPELFPEGEGGFGPLPTGFMVSGGGSLSMFADAVSNACGNAPTCSGSTRRFGYTASATYWLMNGFGVTGSYLKPTDVTASGSGTNFTFTSALETRFGTFGAKVGGPAGPIRLYAMGGAAYHTAKTTMTETINATTITNADGTTTTLPGGTQSIGVATQAWGWFAGGGMEAWIKPPVALVIEGGYLPFKGADQNGGESRIDDRIIYLTASLQLHIGRQ